MRLRDLGEVSDWLLLRQHHGRLALRGSFAIALLPAGLLDAGDLTGMSQLSEADAAYSVFAKIGVRSAADLTSVVSP